MSWKTERKGECERRKESQRRRRKKKEARLDWREGLLTIVGDDGDVDDGEDGKSANSGRPKEDLVVQEVHLEDASFEMLALEGVQHDDESQGRETGGSSSVDVLASGLVSSVIASEAEIWERKKGRSQLEKGDSKDEVSD